MVLRLGDGETVMAMDEGGNLAVPLLSIKG